MIIFLPYMRESIQTRFPVRISSHLEIELVLKSANKLQIMGDLQQNEEALTKVKDQDWPEQGWNSEEGWLLCRAFAFYPGFASYLEDKDCSGILQEAS
jgi:hypothetical protein